MDTDRQPNETSDPLADASTSSDALRLLEEAGFGANLRPATQPGDLCCGACNEISAANDFEVVQERRLEGASDPDDMVLIVAARCPRCEAGGVIVLGYGPEASPEDADLVLALSPPPTPR